MADKYNMSDVFISYAREDKPFAQRLDAALRAAGRECWVDWEDIPLSADWLQEVKAGIESAETFLFIISPASLNSGPCSQEIIHAAEHGKRIVPLLRTRPGEEDMKKMHPKLSAHNWVFFDKDEEFAQSVSNLNQALDTDMDYVRMHTRILVRSGEWIEQGTNPSLLLRGDDLKYAEAWLSQTEGKTPEVTEKQKQYVLTSRKAAVASRRRSTAVLILVLTFAALSLIAILGFVRAEEQRQIASDNATAAEEARLIAVAERDQSVRNATAAHAQSLASSSMVALADNNTDLSILLAMEAVEVDRDNDSAERALAAAAYSPGTRKVLAQESAFAEGVFPTSIAYSPDGSVAASGLSDGAVMIWPLITPDGAPRPPRTWTGHTDAVNALAFTPDGRTLLSASDDGAVLVWSMRDGTVRYRLEGHLGKVNSIAVSPDGLKALSAGEDALLIYWNLENGAEIRRFSGHRGPVSDVAFEAEGRFFVSGSDDGSLILWQPEDGEIVWRAEVNEGGINTVAYEPSGNFIASGGDDMIVRLWSAADGEMLREMGIGQIIHTDWISEVEFTPDGRRLISAAEDNKVVVWDFITGADLTRLRGHRAQINGMAIAPNGVNILTTSVDRTIRQWDRDNGGESGRFSLSTQKSDVSSIVYNHADQHIYAVNDEGSIFEWDTENLKQVRLFRPGDQPVISLVFSADGTQGASVTGSRKEIVVWNVESGEIWSTISAHSEFTTFNPTGLAFTSDNRYLLAAESDFIIRLYDLETGEALRRFEKHTDEVVSLTVHPEGREFVSGSWDSSIILWDQESGEIIRIMSHSDSIQKVVYSPDGQHLLSASWDNSMRLWRLPEGEEKKRFEGHIGAVVSADFNSDGTQVISGAADGTVRVWEVETNVEKLRFTSHDGAIQGVAYITDNLAISNSRDGTARIWFIHSLDQLIEWVTQNRFIPLPSCFERELYQIEPLCDQLTAAIAQNSAKVYRQPDTKSPVISEVYLGESYPIINEDTRDNIEWYQIQMASGQRGWIRASEIEVQESTS